MQDTLFNVWRRAGPGNRELVGRSLRDGMHAGALAVWLVTTLNTLGVTHPRDRVEFALTCVPPVLVTLFASMSGLMTEEMYDAVVTANLHRVALPDFVPLARLSPAANVRHAALVRAATASPNTPCMLDDMGCRGGLSCYVLPADHRVSFTMSGKSGADHKFAYTYNGVDTLRVCMEGPGICGAFVCVLDDVRRRYRYHKGGAFDVPLGTDGAYVLVLPRVSPAGPDGLAATRSPATPAPSPRHKRRHRW